MKKTVIFYYSKHHGNTKKVVEAMKKQGEVTLVELPLKKKVSLEQYDLIGFASGIYMGKFHDSIKKLIKEMEKQLQGKETFLIYTSGSKSKKAEEEIKEELKAAGSKVQGAFRCKGYDTYGIFKMIGGLNRNHPNEKDLNNAEEFIKELF